MGYRSDVRIITTRKGFDELKKYTDNYLKERNWKNGNLLDDCNVYCETKDSKYFGWDGIKWYDNFDVYEDVDAIMNRLNDLANKDLSYRYARIGEEYSDYAEDFYDSSNKNEQSLEYPSFLRYFDDDWTTENIKEYEKKEEEVIEL